MHRTASPPSRPLSVWLAGRIDWHRYAVLAERLAGETTTPGGRNPTLVIFELEPCITIGRLGSRADVAIPDEELAARQLAVRFTGRGGGAVLHGPGQVCVAMFASLVDLGLASNAVGACVERFEQGLEQALRSLRCGPMRHPGVHGLSGRTGLVAAVGLAARRGGIAHGGFVNVCSAFDLAHRVTSQKRPLADGRQVAMTMGSIEAEIRRRVRLQDARTTLVAAITESFGFDAPHVHSGFPVMPAALGSSLSETISRVG